MLLCSKKKKVKYFQSHAPSFGFGTLYLIWPVKWPYGLADVVTPKGVWWCEPHAQETRKTTAFVLPAHTHPVIPRKEMLRATLWVFWNSDSSIENSSGVAFPKVIHGITAAVTGSVKALDISSVKHRQGTSKVIWGLNENNTCGKNHLTAGLPGATGHPFFFLLDGSIGTENPRVLTTSFYPLFYLVGSLASKSPLSPTSSVTLLWNVCLILWTFQVS